MKKKTIFMLLMLSATMLFAACGKEDSQETASLFESMENGTQQEEIKQEEAEQPGEQDQTSEDKNDEITEEQAYNAVINYCKANNPDFDGEMNSEGYTEYWDVSTNENGEIVVLYRSYTAAQIRYYVNPTSGETYVTELVPGIIDDEQKTDETFNIRDYLGEN